ncbi:MAG: YkgJ family cysteine cluster protein [Reyranellaceae bacterium]
MADSGHSTATLRLTVGTLMIAHPISVPNRPVAAAEIVPALQGLVNAVVAAAEADQPVSCRKGCGACCRQLVPVSRSEGERLLQLVERLPPPRRKALEARFAEAAARLAAAGLTERQGRSDRDLSAAYFGLGLPCPFLEAESCSIHPERPLVCREYLVTSPAERCAGPNQEGVTPLPVPKVSAAARGLQDEADDWFPLALLLDWGRRRPKGGARRPGPEWIQRFLQRLSGR